MKINQEESIKVYLKIKSPKKMDNPYYDIDLNKNIFSLHSDKISKMSIQKKSEEEETFKINLNKIFTEENKNSYIYKKTCSEVIKECLNGLSFCFISHGETVSDKLITLIGDITNEEKNEQYKGIFPRILYELYTTNNISVSFSFICVNNNKLIDMNNFIEGDISNFRGENFLKEGKIIQNDKNLINYIKKIPINNYNFILSFVNSIISLIIKLENEKNDNFYSTSHIAIILYINTKNGGENISKLCFILLNGCEKLSIARNIKENNIEYYQNLNNEQKKKSISSLKCSIITQNTYNSIIYLIKQNRRINMNKNNNFIDQEQEKNINLKESKYISNLTAVLYNICFDWRIKNIRYIIYGNIYPNTGYYKAVKESLFFLYEFCKMNKRHIREDEKANNISDNEDYEILNASLFELEIQLKQKNQMIDALNELITNKNKKISIIEQDYNFQVNKLKKSLGFVGDVNILLSGDEYTPEAQRAKRIRDSQFKVSNLNDKLKELENKLKKSREEVKKYKLIKEISNTDEIMIKYNQSVKIAEENKENERKKNSLILQKMDNMEKELKNKDKIINELKKDLSIKNNIIKNFSPIINNCNNIDYDKNESKRSESETKRKKENKKLDTQSNKDEYENKYLYNIINEKENIIDTLKDEIKYLNEKIQNIEREIEEKTNEMNELNKKNEYNTSEIQITQNEYLKYNKLIMSLFNEYHLYFLQKSKNNISLVTLSNKVEEFNKIVTDIESDINFFTFPKLHQLLESKNLLSINYKTVLPKKNKSKLHFSKKKKISMEDIGSSPVTPRKDKKYSLIYKILNNFTENEKIKKNKNKDFNILSKDELEKMDLPKIIEYCIQLHSKISEFDKKIEQFDGINFENEKNKKQIYYLNDKIKRIRNALDEQVNINNKNKIVITSQNRTIEKFNQNICLINFLKKDQKEKLSLSARKNTKSTLLFNKSQVNLKTNGDYIYNNKYNNKDFSSQNKKYKVTKNKKGLYIPIDNME